jgi:hypothetical protein
MTSPFFISSVTPAIREHIFYLVGRVPDWPHVFRLAAQLLWDGCHSRDDLLLVERNLKHDTDTDGTKVVYMMEFVQSYLRNVGHKLEVPCSGYAAQVALANEHEAARRVFGLRLVCKQFRDEIDGSAFLYRYFANCFYVQISKVLSRIMGSNMIDSDGFTFIPQPNNYMFIPKPVMFGAHTAIRLVAWSGPAYSAYRTMWDRMISFGCVPPDSGIRLVMEGMADWHTPVPGLGTHPNFTRYRLVYDRVQGPRTGKLSIITETIVMPDDMFAKKCSTPASKRQKTNDGAVSQAERIKVISEAETLLNRVFREGRFEVSMGCLYTQFPRPSTEVVLYQRMLTCVEQDLQDTNRRRSQFEM